MIDARDVSLQFSMLTLSIPSQRTLKMVSTLLCTTILLFIISLAPSMHSWYLEKIQGFNPWTTLWKLPFWPKKIVIDVRMFTPFQRLSGSASIALLPITTKLVNTSHKTNSMEGFFSVPRKIAKLLKCKTFNWKWQITH